MFRVLASSLLLAVGSAVAAQPTTLPVEGKLLTGWREANGLHIAGLELRLAPGWKTYWRAPGAGGIPPRFNWSGSRNLSHVDVRYPIPKVMDQNGVRSIGYDDDVVFPLVVTAHDPGKPVRIRAEIEVGVCEEVCIPMTLQLAVDLPTGGAYDASIGSILDNQPRQGGAFDCDITSISDGLVLRAETGGASMRAEIVVIETSVPGVWVSPSDTTQNGAQLVAEVEMVPPSAQPFALSRDEVRMTLIGGGQAIEMQGCR